MDVVDFAREVNTARAGGVVARDSTVFDWSKSHCRLSATSDSIFNDMSSLAPFLVPDQSDVLVFPILFFLKTAHFLS